MKHLRVRKYPDKDAVEQQRKRDDVETRKGCGGTVFNRFGVSLNFEDEIS